MACTVDFDTVRPLSLALYQSIETLECSEAHLHNETQQQSESEHAPLLVHAARVAKASCEDALTRVDSLLILIETGAGDIASLTSCQEFVDNALVNASTVSRALEHTRACTRLSSVDLLCGEEAMGAAIEADDLGALALSVVLFQETLQSTEILAARKLVHLGIAIKKEKTCNANILRLLLSVPAIAASANIFSANIFGRKRTALMIAAANGHRDAVGVLLACPVVAQFADARDSLGNTSLMLASLFDHTETVSALLVCPVVVRSADSGNTFGNTALMQASMYASDETVVALLACHSIVLTAAAANTNYGNTALMMASIWGKIKCVSALLACPVVLKTAHACNKWGMTALTLALQNRHHAVFSLIDDATKNKQLKHVESSVCV
jgi:ankyrin repeat protein